MHAFMSPDACTTSGTTPSAKPAAACLNCDEPFGHPPPRYCPACGQESNIKPPTLMEFAQQFGGAYISTEGALWRTLKLLLFKPGAATREYLDGRRRRYVLPLRLYLTISVVVLLLMRLFVDVNMRIDPTVDTARIPKAVTLQLGFGQAGVREGKFFCSGPPAWMCTRLQKRYGIDAGGLQREIDATGQRFVAQFGGSLFVLLPSFALWLRLVYRNRGMRYTEHLVFALHTHAFWFLMLGLMLVDVAWVTATAALVVPAYTLLAMHRVYGGRWWPLLLRAAVVTTLYGLMLMLALAGVSLWAIVM